jgi:hypothetical protein
MGSEMPQQSFRFAEQKTIDERFGEFLEANPHFFPAFRKAAIQLLAAGHKRYSARGIVEGLRFNASFETTSLDGWKINDHFTSRLARKLMGEDGRFIGFFEVRKLKSRKDDR